MYPLNWHVTFSEIKKEKKLTFINHLIHLRKQSQYLADSYLARQQNPCLLCSMNVCDRYRVSQPLDPILYCINLFTPSNLLPVSIA